MKLFRNKIVLLPYQINNEYETPICHRALRTDYHLQYGKFYQLQGNGA